MRKTTIWVIAFAVSLILMVSLYSIGIKVRGYYSPGSEVILMAVPLIGAVFVNGEKRKGGRLLRKRALFMAKAKKEWVQAHGTALSLDEEEVFAQRQHNESDYFERLCSKLKWHPIKETPQECIKRATEKGMTVYIVSPTGLSKCDGKTFAFNMRPIEANDSVFYMKAKGITKGAGDGWGGLKIAFTLPGGVITQEEALNHFGKQRLLDILGYGDYADDIEFISKSEYIQNYSHELCATDGGDRYAKAI